MRTTGRITTTQNQTKQMKKLLTFTTVIGVVAIMCGLVGCSTTTNNTTEIRTSQKEMLLTQAGFKAMPVTTPAHQKELSKLPVDKVSAVKNQGKLYYVYPTGAKDQILIGRQAQFDAYKKMLAPKIQAQASAPQQSSPPPGAYLSRETAGPNRIEVDTFDGFGPIQDNPAWQ
jgi:hypothetical protein